MIQDLQNMLGYTHPFKGSVMFSEIPKDEEFLEAVISAMRSLLLMIASKNIPQVKNVLILLNDILGSF